MQIQQGEEKETGVSTLVPTPIVIEDGVTTGPDLKDVDLIAAEDTEIQVSCSSILGIRGLPDWRFMSIMPREERIPDLILFRIWKDCPGLRCRTPNYL